MTVRSKSIMTHRLNWSGVGVSANPHVSVPSADLWIPQTEVTVIGAYVNAGWNQPPNSALLDTGGVYCYAEIALTARQHEEQGILVEALQAEDPIETPTIGEHETSGLRVVRMQVMFPEGYRIDLDQWHALYLNVGYRGFLSTSPEFFASGLVWFVLR